jgi:predicted hotdog family 3-hydroxylacyl-ACP dehydratase
VRPFPPTSDLVPHSPPTLALDELVAWSPGEARLRLCVRDDTLLVRDRRLDSVVTLELMAQAVAACLGYEAFRDGGGVRVGMVVACRRMTIARPAIAVGEPLEFTVRRLRGNDFVSTFATETRGGDGELVASATMTIVHGERPPG